jgi:predicted transcriptional regulator
VHALQDPVARIKSLKVPVSYPEIDLVRLVNCKVFESCMKNELRCTIVSLLARGATTANEVASALGISRTAIYRHLNALRKNGIITYYNGRFYVGARLFLVYDVEVDEKGYIKLIIHPDKGGFADESIGFAFVKGKLCKCDICITKDKCLAAVKNLARKLDIKLRSEEPLSGFREIVEEIVKRDIVKVIKEGYLIIRIPEEVSREEGEYLQGLPQNEKTRV